MPPLRLAIGENGSAFAVAPARSRVYSKFEMAAQTAASEVVYPFQLKQKNSATEYTEKNENTENRERHMPFSLYPLRLCDEAEFG